MVFIVIIGVAALALVTVGVIVSRLIHVCSPNEVLVFYGRRRKQGSKRVGYRLVQGGRGFRAPLFERVAKLDLTNMSIYIRVKGAYSRGGIPLNVEGVANIKIASTEPVIGNAIERFLGKSRQDISTVARETLEGNLRGVLAMLTPEEVNQDRVKFAESLLSEADIDLQRLGLELDTLKIQNVSDDMGYLDSIGRTQTAGLLMRSRVAEAENQAMAAERSAKNTETQEIARIDAEIAMARAEAKRRIVDAQTQKMAMVAEEKGQVVAAIARAEASVDVQRARLEQVRLQLVADKIKPAEAKRQKLEDSARGSAAKIVEEGKATATALRLMGETWAQAGDSAREIVIAQKLSGLVGKLMETVKDVRVDKVTFIDEGLTKGGSNVAVKAAVASEQLKHTLGLDIPAMLKGLVATSPEPAK